jgi:DNA-binding MarR family transcriptional regulator
MSAQPWSRPQAGRELRHLVASGNEDALEGFLDVLSVDVAAMCTENDLPRIARAQAQVTRWLTRTLDGKAPAAKHADKRLRTLAAQLDTGWRSASLRADAKHRIPVVTTLRQQILDLLAVAPLRPSEIARGLSCDPVQVSRALRTLSKSGDVHNVKPVGRDDQRAVVYARTERPPSALIA